MIYYIIYVKLSLNNGLALVRKKKKNYVIKKINSPCKLFLIYKIL